jgi:DNA gyrase subunit B
MPELIEAGYVYIAKPPLYKLKQGRRERYIESESELEEILLLDKLERFEITDRKGVSWKLTEARWQRLVRLVRQFEAASSSLRAQYGIDTVRFLGDSGVLEQASANADAVAALFAQALPVDGHVTELIERSPDELRVRVTETSTGFARTHRLRPALFESGDYQQLLGRHAALVELAGTPPFAISLGDDHQIARTFDDLRAAVLTLSQKGVGLDRFKGLGEMNADQLAETTMDPAHRTLAQVTIDNAIEADKVFSMLMGDQVEPRRQFIERNARLVTNLDV